MSRPATSGIAAIRLKLATVRAAAEIRRALRMKPPQAARRVPAHEDVHNRRRRGRLDAELAAIGNLLENLWRFSE
jgi:hypothetical protein